MWDENPEPIPGVHVRGFTADYVIMDDSGDGTGFEYSAFVSATARPEVKLAWLYLSQCKEAGEG